MLYSGTDPESYIIEYTSVYEDKCGWRRGGCDLQGGSEAGSYVRLIDSCITQRKAQRPFRTCNESKEATSKGGPCRWRMYHARV